MSLFISTWHKRGAWRAVADCDAHMLRVLADLLEADPWLNVRVRIDRLKGDKAGSWYQHCYQQNTTNIPTKLATLLATISPTLSQHSGNILTTFVLHKPLIYAV